MENQVVWDRRRLLRLIIPLVIEQVLAVTIGMADIVMVSSAGEAAVSGISLVDSINVLLINIFSALATGGAVVGAQYLGKRDRESACEAAKQLVLAVAALSLVIAAFALVAKDWLLQIIFGHVEAAVMANAQVYFFLSALSYPFLAIYNAGAALFRAMGNSKISMLISGGMNIINIVGNAILIFGFHLDVAGAAIASLISRIAGCVVIMILLMKPVHEIFIKSLFPLKINWEMIRNILRIGVPNGLENSMFQFGKILVQGLVSSFGTAAIAANAVAGNVAALEIIPGSSLGLATITVIGQCVGARDYDSAVKYTKKLMLITYVFTAALNLPLLLLIPSIVSFYSLSGEAMTLAIELLIFHGICTTIIWPLGFTLPNALRAANDVKYTMIVSVVTMWTCRIGMSYLLALTFHMGVMGVWVAMVMDWCVRAVFFSIRFLRGKWKEKQYI